MKWNGSMTAHSREWPLYERCEVRDGRTVMVLSLSPEDRAKKERLDEINFELERRGCEHARKAGIVGAAMGDLQKSLIPERMTMEKNTAPVRAGTTWAQPRPSLVKRSDKSIGRE
jgi:hypothetical protein